MSSVVALLESNPDWIQLTNAATIRAAQGAGHVVMLRNPALDLSALGLTANDTLFLLGHGNTDSAGDFDGAGLAAELAARHLPKNHRLIRMTSCNAGSKDVFGMTFIGTLVDELHALGYNVVSVSGAKGLAISGWGVDRVVKPSREAAYDPKQDAAEAANAVFITRAKALASGITIASPERDIIAVANAIAQLTEYFYEHLALHASSTLVDPSKSGFRVAH